MNKNNLKKKFLTPLELKTEKQFLNTTYYNLAYIKDKNLNRSSTLYSLETYNNITNTSDFSNKEIGNSIATVSYSLHSNLNRALSFYSELCVSNSVLDNSHLEKLEKTLSSTKVLDRSYKSLIVLNAIKGGFRAYYYGVVGFLPKSQAMYFLKEYLKSLKKFLNLNTKSYNLFYMSNLIVKTLPKLILRVSSIYIGKLNLYTISLKRFSFFKKKRNIFNDLTMIFLVKL
jgi:hypothetical protein